MWATLGAADAAGAPGDHCSLLTSEPSGAIRHISLFRITQGSVVVSVCFFVFAFFRSVLETLFPCLAACLQTVLLFSLHTTTFTVSVCVCSQCRVQVAIAMCANCQVHSPLEPYLCITAQWLPLISTAAAHSLIAAETSRRQCQVALLPTSGALGRCWSMDIAHTQWRLNTSDADI